MQARPSPGVPCPLRGGHGADGRGLCTEGSPHTLAPEAYAGSKAVCAVAPANPVLRGPSLVCLYGNNCWRRRCWNGVT